MDRRFAIKQMLARTAALCASNTLISATDGAEDRSREHVSILDHWDLSDGDNLRPAILRGLKFMNGRGGNLVIPPQPKGGLDYPISGTQATVPLRELGTGFAYTGSMLQAQLLLDATYHDVGIVFDGTRLVSDAKHGGGTLVIDSASRIRLVRPRMKGATAMSAGSTVTAGTSGIVLLSNERPCEEITIDSPEFEDHYTGIDIAGDPAGPHRVRKVEVTGTAKYTGGVYGLACRGNGTAVRALTGYSLRQNRPFFIYDTSDVEVGMVGDQIAPGFQALIKAYTTPTTHIKARLVVRNRTNNQARLGLQVQHDPDVVAVPPYLRHLEIDYVELEDVLGGDSITMDYYRKAARQATSSDLLFTDIEIRGSSVGDLKSTVKLMSSAHRCILDMRNFRAGNGEAIFSSGTGFVPATLSPGATSAKGG